MGSQRYQDVAADDVLSRFQRGEKLIIVDVRQPDEYAAGHIPGAILIPLPNLEDYLDQLDKETEIFLVCRSGVRSRTAAKILAEKGFRQVRNISGGMLAWKGPVER
ncbi:MAG: rhodanese-like domain-containing protein [Firmicutes bacterium]|nr:rhodanese-like domain-containing protein [Bacillota bacterium]